MNTASKTPLSREVFLQQYVLRMGSSAATELRKNVADEALAVWEKISQEGGAKQSLLPCPFCGSDEVGLKKKKTVIVECKKCGALIIKMNISDAVQAWNQRPSGMPWECSETAMGILKQRGEGKK